VLYLSCDYFLGVPRPFSQEQIDSALDEPLYYPDHDLDYYHNVNNYALAQTNFSLLVDVQYFYAGRAKQKAHQIGKFDNKQQVNSVKLKVHNGSIPARIHRTAGGGFLHLCPIPKETLNWLKELS